MAKYRLLSLDGGGVRGALSLRILQRLDQMLPGFLDQVRLLGGTSTGAFIALGLANGKSPEAIGELYSEASTQFIFTPKYFNLYRPRYGNENLRALLERFFTPELRLSDLERQVIVPAFQLVGPDDSQWRPVFYHNFADSENRDEPVVNVALASSAAPTYFPSFENQIDGGAFANNPSLATLAFAKDPDRGRHYLDEIVMLSLGTGMTPQKLTTDTSGWGQLQWALNPWGTPDFPLGTILFDGTGEANTIFCRQLLEERYCRVNPVLAETIPLDDYTQIPVLTDLAEHYDLTPVLQWLGEYWL